MNLLKLHKVTDGSKVLKTCETFHNVHIMHLKRKITIKRSQKRNRLPYFSLVFTCLHGRHQVKHVERAVVFRSVACHCHEHAQSPISALRSSVPMRDKRQAQTSRKRPVGSDSYLILLH